MLHLNITRYCLRSNDMIQETLKAKWNDLKDKVVQQWEKLTEEDVAKIKGKVEELIKTVQNKYGYEKEHAEKEVKNFMDKHTKD
jgi:uncharacterized protein YjbJ (UPF0337 family)